MQMVVETLLIIPVDALRLAVVTRRFRTNQLAFDVWLFVRRSAVPTRLWKNFGRCSFQRKLFSGKSANEMYAVSKAK